MRKVLLFCGENFYLEGMRVFSKAHFEAFSDPSGPESRPIHSFSIILVPNWTHFLNLLESSPGAQYQHFHSNHQILMFLNIESTGASVEILTFEHFGVQLSTFLTLLESCSRCTISTFSFQYCLRVKFEQKPTKSFHTWQIWFKPKKP